MLIVFLIFIAVSEPRQVHRRERHRRRAGFQEDGLSHGRSWTNTRTEDEHIQGTALC